MTLGPWARCAWCSELLNGIPHDHVVAEMYPDWQDRANCIDEDVHQFFPDRGMSDRGPMLLCFSCPVRVECLSLALRRPEKLGIWGGSTQDQRAVIWRQGLSHEEMLQMAIALTEAAAERRRLYTKEKVA